MNGSERRVPLEVKGIVFVLTLLLLVWLAVAAYQKRFVSSVDVVLRVERAGLMLPVGGDVRMRGSLVGRIDDVRLDDEGVDIRLALNPEDARQIPADAVGRVLPTTLFGVKYVELVDPSPGADRPAVRADAVLSEDTSSQTVEVTRVLDRLQPLLTAVRPQALSVALQAVATGLEDRGESLGRLAVRTRSYLATVEDSLPTLMRDLNLLATVSRTYADATPDVLRLLDNATLTGETVLDNKDKLAAFLRDATVFADHTRAFLDRNGDGIAELNRSTRPILELLATYSPQLPCLVRGIIFAETEAGKAFQDGALRAYVRLGDQYGAYTPDDAPQYGDLGAGPNCRGLPHPPVPLPEPRSDDGADYPPGSPLPPLVVNP